MNFVRFAIVLAIAAMFPAASQNPVWAQSQPSTPQGATATADASHNIEGDSKADAAAAGHDADQAAVAPEDKLIIVRNLSGEFAKARQPLPGGKDVFKLPADQPLDQKRLENWVRTHGGPKANPGDQVQITMIEFQPHAILFQYNGGGKKKFHWREHLQIGMGAGNDDPLPVEHPGEGVGGTIILDYGRPLPPLNSEEIKEQLASLFDFSKQSATKQWLDTLEPQYQDGIKDHRAVVGMDAEMVTAALGHPDKKIRSRDGDGNDTEDWIYGNPPARTTFVTFVGGKVTKVKEFS